MNERILHGSLEDRLRRVEENQIEMGVYTPGQRKWRTLLQGMMLLLLLVAVVLALLWTGRSTQQNQDRIDQNQERIHAEAQILTAVRVYVCGNAATQHAATVTRQMGESERRFHRRIKLFALQAARARAFGCPDTGLPLFFDRPGHRVKVTKRGRVVSIGHGGSFFVLPVPGSAQGGTTHVRSDGGSTPQSSPVIPKPPSPPTGGGGGGNPMPLPMPKLPSTPTIPKLPILP